MATCRWRDCDRDAVQGFRMPFGTYVFCEDHLLAALNDWTGVEECGA